MWATHSQVNGCHLKISVEGDRREDFIMVPKQLAFPNMSLDVGQVWGIRADCCGITRRKETQPSVEQQVYRDSLCSIPAPLYSSQPCTWKSHPCVCSSQFFFCFLPEGSENNSWPPAQPQCVANTPAICASSLLTCFQMRLPWSTELISQRWGFCPSPELQVTLQQNCMC